jgi:hypothetical protein
MSRVPSTASEKERPKSHCSNPACGATVPADRARCPRCGQKLETSRAAELESMRGALDKHTRRFSTLANEANRVTAAAQRAIDDHRRRSLAELEERLAEEIGESQRRAREQFDAVARRARELAHTDTGLRVGTLSVPNPGTAGESVELPVLAPLLDAGHLVVRAPSRQREKAIGLLGGVLLQALAGRPAGQVRYRVFDPVGIGSSLSAFGEFDSERVAHGLPISSREELRTAVAELSGHATYVSSTYLRGKHRSLGEFLAEAGPGFAPYEILVLLDCPAEMEDEERDDLAQLAAHAASRGISILAHVDAERGEPPDFGPDATAIECDRAGRWRCSLVPGATLRLDGPPAGTAIEAAAARPVAPPPALEFGDLHPAGEVFAASSAEGLTVPLGRAGLRPVDVRLDDSSVHGLIAGDTGSGKSNLLRVLIYGLARRYAPSELELYLLDFKEGVEFREFAPSAGDPTFLPHASVVSVNSDRAFGVEVLEHLARVAAERYAALPESARNIAALRARDPDLPFPRVLLVIDEFQVLFSRPDLLADRAAAALAKLASQGRAAGVHFLLATQSISDVAAGTQAAAGLDPVYKNSRLRIGLRLGEEESRTLLRITNTAAAEIRERGVAIVNHDEGAEQGNVLTRVAFISDEQALHERREAVSRAIGAARPARVYNGERGADPTHSPALRKRGGGPGAWVGASLEIGAESPRTEAGLLAPLPPDPNRHLAVAGAGARAAASILQWSAIGFARRAEAEPTQLLLVDLLRPDDRAPTGLVEATAVAIEAAGAAVEVVRERDALLTMPRIEELLLSPSAAPRAAVVFGFDRLDNFERPYDAAIDEFEPDSPKRSLERVLAGAGTRHGHLLAWWSSYDAFAQQAGMLDTSFGLRAYLGLPEQQLQLIAPGQMDAPAAHPLAYWHDYAAGAAPHLFHVYEPFGSAEAPAFLAK